MVDMDIEISEYLGRTTVDAAAVGLYLMDVILDLAGDVTVSLANGRIQFQAAHPFCTIQPHATYICCDVKHNGRSQSIQLTSLADYNPTLQQQLWDAYQHSGT
jgi:hypothetical protein